MDRTGCAAGHVRSLKEIGQESNQIERFIILDDPPSLWSSSSYDVNKISIFSIKVQICILRYAPKRFRDSIGFKDDPSELATERAASVASLSPTYNTRVLRIRFYIQFLSDGCLNKCPIIYLCVLITLIIMYCVLVTEIDNAESFIDPFIFYCISSKKRTRFIRRNDDSVVACDF